MSDTPRTDAAEAEYEDGSRTVVYADFARRLERELAAAAAARDKAVAALKELNLDVGSAKADALVAELESILTP